MTNNESGGSSAKNTHSDSVLYRYRNEGFLIIGLTGTALLIFGYRGGPAVAISLAFLYLNAKREAYHE